jgi:chromosomal replication initiation ATPase DnaA
MLNAADEAGVAVLLAAREPAARWPVAVPDLASRLRATAAVRVYPADDDLLRSLLLRLLIERGSGINETALDWLLRRLPRTAAAIREAAARLDRCSLALGRPVTRAVAEMVLDEMAQAGLTSSETTESLAEAAPPGSSDDPGLVPVGTW